jgi:hypothetical protein
MNDKEKRARFRALAQQDHIKTEQQFAEEREQPCFDFEGEPAPARRRKVPGYLLIDDVVMSPERLARLRRRR